MSTSARDIPVVVRRADPGAPLPTEYSTTPHGTIYSTTPGGTRIIYDRNKLLALRNSPLSRTPPANMANIPGVTRASYSGPGSSLPVHPSSLSRSVSASDVADSTEHHHHLATLPSTAEEDGHAQRFDYARHANAADYEDDEADSDGEPHRRQHPQPISATSSTEQSTTASGAHTKHKGDDLFEMEME